MKPKANTILILAMVLLFITAADAQDLADRYGGPNSREATLAMMGGGGGGMMGSGGMTSGGGIFNSFGWPQSEVRNPGDENRQNQNGDNQRIHREEIERLHERVQQKRKELSSLYRSGTPNKKEISRKIDELSNLEHDLDDKISSYDNR